MKTLIILITAVLLIIIIRKVLILSKRKYRRMELRHHVDMILDSAGCDHSIEHYKSCDHIIHHYNIKLSEICFQGGLGRLAHETKLSDMRAKNREAHYSKRNQ